MNRYIQEDIEQAQARLTLLDKELLAEGWKCGSCTVRFGDYENNNRYDELMSGKPLNEWVQGLLVDVIYTPEKFKKAHPDEGFCHFTYELINGKNALYFETEFADIGNETWDSKLQKLCALTLTKAIFEGKFSGCTDPFLEVEGYR